MSTHSTQIVVSDRFYIKTPFRENMGRNKDKVSQIQNLGNSIRQMTQVLEDTKKTKYRKNCYRLKHT